MVYFLQFSGQNSNGPQFLLSCLLHAYGQTFSFQIQNQMCGERTHSFALRLSGQTEKVNYQNKNTNT
jgi:hypothetical protein